MTKPLVGLVAVGVIVNERASQGPSTSLWLACSLYSFDLLWKYDGYSWLQCVAELRRVRKHSVVEGLLR